MPAVASPLTGARVDADDPGRLPGAAALLHERGARMPLPGEPAVPRPLFLRIPPSVDAP
ncbi:hypothetical protein ACFPN0_18560 [Kitasatospora cinereorecta]